MWLAFLVFTDPGPSVLSPASRSTRCSHYTGSKGAARGTRSFSPCRPRGTARFLSRLYGKPTAPSPGCLPSRHTRARRQRSLPLKAAASARPAPHSRRAAVAVLIGDGLDAAGAGHSNIAALETQIDAHHRHGCDTKGRRRLRGSGGARRG